MKKALIVLGVLAAVAVLIIGGFALFMSNGLKPTETLIIGSIDPSGLADGTYEGSYGGGRFSNKVAVAVEGGKITAINAIKTVVFEREDLTRKLFDGVIASQSTDVDVETGATVTTNAYLKSIEDALDGK